MKDSAAMRVQHPADIMRLCRGTCCGSWTARCGQWGAQTWTGLWARWGSPILARTLGCLPRTDGSKRLVGTSFDEDLRQGKLTFFEYNERMELLYRTTAELPVHHFLSQPASEVYT